MLLPQVNGGLPYNSPNVTLRNNKTKFQPHFSHFTQGSNANRRHELIHFLSKDTSEKIDKLPVINPAHPSSDKNTYRVSFSALILD